MTCEVQKQSVTQESIMNVSHQQTTSQSHSERKERKSLTATSPMSPRSQGSQEEAPTTPVTPSSYRLASKNTRMSRSSKTPHDSNNSNDATEAVTVSDTDSASESSSLCLPCFFPNHRVLDGEYPRRVVKYANRRLTKAKIVPDARALQMPQLKHSHIKIDKLLGEGSFSSVFSINYVARETSFEASRLPEDEELVCKVLRKKILNNPAMLAACAADLVKEGLLLARCNHPHILSIYGWAQDGVDAYKSGRHDAFFLVMGKLDTTLSDKLKAWRSFKAQHQTKLWNKVFPKTEIVTEKLESFRERLHILKDLGKAVVYLHSQNILHRDLKPDNIGFAPDGTLKIFDFDVARLLPLGRSASLNNVHAGETQRIFQMTRRVGSPRYMSPECARGDPYNAKADVYTFSLLVHELYCLEKPYEEVPAELHDEMIFYQGVRPPLTKTWPNPLKRLMCRSWSENLDDRPTMAELLAQWTVLIPILVADKERKYNKFSWWKSKPKLPAMNDSDEATLPSGHRTGTRMDKNHKNIPFFLSSSSRVESGLSSKRGVSNWETSARTTLSSCAEPDS